MNILDQLADKGRLMSLSEAADILDINVKTVRKMIKDGELQGVRVRGRIKVAPSDLRNYLEVNKTCADATGLE